MNVHFAAYRIPRGLAVNVEFALGSFEVVVDDCGFQLGWPYRRASLRAWSCGVGFWSIKVGRRAWYWSHGCGSGTELSQA